MVPEICISFLGVTTVSHLRDRLFYTSVNIKMDAWRRVSLYDERITLNRNICWRVDYVDGA